jgi:hypothetical protein
MKKQSRREIVFLMMLALPGLVANLAQAADSSAASSELESPVSFEEAQANPELTAPAEFEADDFSDDPTIDELRDELGNLGYDEEDFPLDLRIRHYDPATSEGKIIIKIHKSSAKGKLEYMEVFKQNSKDGNALSPFNIFAGENKALVSTAGTYGSKTYVTPSGVFNIDLMEKMHYSSKYNNAPMPWSMFFNGGVAIHGATPSEFKQLGHKASHGCVRLHPQNAKILYAAIQASERGAIIMVLES